MEINWIFILWRFSFFSFHLHTACCVYNIVYLSYEYIWSDGKWFNQSKVGHIIGKWN